MNHNSDEIDFSPEDLSRILYLILQEFTTGFSYDLNGITNPTIMEQAEAQLLFNQVVTDDGIIEHCLGERKI